MARTPDAHPANHDANDTRRANQSIAASRWASVTPSRCFVAQEWVLSAALDQALAVLPRIPECALTLGMLDLEDGIDEDYLIVSRADRTPGLVIQGMARRPVWWTARHLRRQGAMIASGIQIGYAGAFAAHIFNYWPELAAKVMELTATAMKADVEKELPADLCRDGPSGLLIGRFMVGGSALSADPDAGSKGSECSRAHR
jgi:hypothetical protein